MPEITESSSSDHVFQLLDNPLYISNSDQASLQLTSYKFNGTNFIHWKKDIIQTLISKNKDGFIDRTCVRPAATDSKLSQWIRCDILVLRWILNSVEPVLQKHFQYATSAANLWDDICETYGQVNAIELYALKQQLSRIHQDNASIIEYYTQLKCFWETIDSLDPLPECTCGALAKCSCHLVKRLLDRESNAKLIQLLMGLNSSFEQLKTHMLSLEPLPMITKAVGMLQKIERQKSIDDDAAHHVTPDSFAHHTSSAVYAANTLSSSRSTTSTSNWKRQKTDTKLPKECTHCLRKGHMVEDCFKLQTCSHCHVRGHVKEHCYKLKNHLKRQGRYGSASHVSAQSHLANSPLDGHQETLHEALQNAALVTSKALSKHVDSGLVKDIMNNALGQVLALVNDVPSSSPASPMSLANFAGMIFSSVNSVHQHFGRFDWVVDSGASDHMTSHFSLLHNVITLCTPLKVALPDGSHKSVTTIGSLHLTPTLTIHNVLFLPDFQQNLLSVGKLLKHNGLTAIFFPTYCLFQDLSTNKTVAIAHKVGELYWLQYSFPEKPINSAGFPSSLTVVNSTSQSSNVINSAKTSTVDKRFNDVCLLHSRLGHPSLDKLKLVHASVLKGISTLTCESCIFAKHHQHPFSRSASYSSNCFDLVHMDVWGPYRTPSRTGAKSFLTILDDHSRHT
ncbi:hypothetical protein vseg_001321 [Gypsophila vaccaria]